MFMMAINGAPVATSDNYNDAVHGFGDHDVGQLCSWWQLMVLLLLLLIIIMMLFMVLMTMMLMVMTMLMIIHYDVGLQLLRVKIMIVND